MMKVAVMQQYQDYSYTPYQPTAKKKDRTSMALIGALFLFMFFGFLGGIVVLAVRNSYLFS